MKFICPCVKILPLTQYPIFLKGCYAHRMASMWTGGLVGTATGYLWSTRLTRRLVSSPLLKMGVRAYNAECRKIIMRYSKEWEVRSFWVEFIIYSEVT